jgi:hypothetical protein
MFFEVLDLAATAVTFGGVSAAEVAVVFATSGAALGVADAEGICAIGGGRSVDIFDSSKNGYE